MSEDRLSRANAKIAALMQRKIDREIMGDAFGSGTNSTTHAEPTTLNANDFVRDMDRLVRNFRRTAVTFVADLAHEGGIIGYQTPGDGWRYEMSFTDARRLHEHQPLKLHKVLNENAAEFVPASTMDPFVPRYLPLPPFDAPDDEADEIAPR